MRLRSRSGSLIWGNFGVALDQLHAIQRNGKLFRHELGLRGVEPMPQLAFAGESGNAAIGGDGHAADAKGALHGLLIDERFLNRMRLRARSQTFERRDLRARDIRYRRDTGPDCLTLDNDRATAALTESAAEFRTAEFQIVAEDIQQRRRWIRVQCVCTAVYLQS